MSLVTLRGVSKTFPQALKPAVEDISLSVEEGERVAIVGQSGSGKTTLLNIALGFTEPTQGEVSIAHPDTTGLVFQNPAASLDPRWTIRDIIAEGVSQKTRVRDDDIEDALRSVKLDPDDLMDRYVSDISGGQAQRVAIARALISHPQLLVADEPVSAVDVLGKQHIIETLKTMQDEQRFAMLIVLHDLGVAQQLSDTIVVMYQGRSVERGATAEVLKNPQHEYTKRLISAARW